MELYPIMVRVWTFYFWLLLGSVALVHHLQTLGCIEEERIGLLKIKQVFESWTIDNTSYSEFSSWDDIGRQETTDCCNWESVKCDSITNQVVKLDLYWFAEFNSSTEVYLNSSLFLPLQELQNLTVWFNDLAGFRGIINSRKIKVLELKHFSIPSFGNQIQNSLKSLKLEYANTSYFQELVELKALEVLDIRYTEMTGPNLEVIWGITSLKSLHLIRMGLNDSLPVVGLMRLKALEVLDMSKNHITGPVPRFIWGMTSLKSLSFTLNNLNGSILGLCNLRNLVKLDLSHNELSGVIPYCLGGLTSLKVLDLSYNFFSGNIPPTIFPNLKLLEYVSFSYNQLDGPFSFSSLSSNSKLEVFNLQHTDEYLQSVRYSYNHSVEYGKNELKVETENPPYWVPLFQLKVLRLSDCKVNEPTGSTPSFLKNQYQLDSVDLSHNNLVGQFPSWLLKYNTSLRSLNLRNNSFTGYLSLNPDIQNLNMEFFDASINRFHGELPNFIGIVLPHLFALNLSMNYFQGFIPASVGAMKDMAVLDLSNNNFSGVIPQHLAMGCTSLFILKLSNNSLHGPLLPERSNMESLTSLCLDNNQFSGELLPGLLNFTRSIFVLKINDNFLTGVIPEDWLGGNSDIETLVLSRNSFEGLLPSSFCRLPYLSFLDLSWNQFQGSIPSCTNLSSVKYLHLQGNKFNGKIPHDLSGLSSLVTLDVRYNELLGNIPPDTISSLSNLMILLLKGNTLEGLIPFQICDLKSLRILDLSSNNFSGIIPSCLYQIPFGSKILIDDLFSINNPPTFIVDPYVTETYSIPGDREEIEFMSKSRSESFKGNILYYMSGIDLSQNKLTGPIPNELGNLSRIKSLNLSHNYLTGLIPTTFSNLKEIESLDISYNKLSGQIPQELTQLNFLAVFSVAFNELSGSVPTTQGQFGTFEKSSYEGNPLLCGPPLEKSCLTHGRLPPALSSTPKQEDDFRDGFKWSFVVSSFAAFSGMISFLYYKGFFNHKRRIFRAKLRK